MELTDYNELSEAELDEIERCLSEYEYTTEAVQSLENKTPAGE